MRSILKFIALALAVPPAAVVIYWTIASVLVFFPYPGEDPSSDDQIRAYVVSNGIHAEFVLPVVSPLIDWRTVFPLSRFAAPPLRPSLVAIGWGEREFYLNTPTWADLTVGRALGALFGHNPSIVHATYLESLAVYPEIYRLRLSRAAHAKLIDYIASTVTLRNGRTVDIPGRGYAGNDAFFLANGRYHFLTTCNSWVGRGLRYAGVKVSRWTPFDWTVTWHLNRGFE